MASQLQTLEMIFAKLNQIYEKLCDIDSRIGGGGDVKFDIPLFFDDKGNIKEDYAITLIEGDSADVERLNGIYSGVVNALKAYSVNPNQDWEAP